MKFIEMSRFKVLLTGCVLLLMLNCYQSYGDNFYVYYDAQSKIVKTERTPNQSTNISVELSGIKTWEAMAQIFTETPKVIKESDIGNNNLYFLYNSGIVDPHMFLLLLHGPVIEENLPQRTSATIALGYLYQLQGKLAEAGACYNDAIKAAKDAKDFTLETTVFAKLGTLQKQQGKLAEAEGCYNDALRAAKAAKDFTLETTVFAKLGTLQK